MVRTMPCYLTQHEPAEIKHEAGRFHVPLGCASYGRTPLAFVMVLIDRRIVATLYLGTPYKNSTYFRTVFQLSYS